MKKLFFVLACLFSLSCFAANTELNYTPIASKGCPSCTDAVIGSPTFCQDFVSSAYCHCEALTPGLCSGTPMSVFYARLLKLGNGSLEKACQRQEHQTCVPADKCIEHWNEFHRLQCKG